MFHKMVRIFVSSTFYNFKNERDGLVAVFQELSEDCKSAGFSFQVLDMRWGISDEDSQNNRTLQICFDEITRCRMLSPKPNFLILSGLYYGWIPLPSFIKKYVWDKIQDEIQDEIPEFSLLRSWYLHDKNDAEGVYILRPRDDNEEDRKTDWKEIEISLKKELFPLIQKHFSDKSKYFELLGLSATEQEIYKGLFCHPEDKENVFVLVRTKEPESCIKRESEDAAAHAAALQTHLKDYMGELIDENMLFYQPGDDYTEKVKAFLKRVIRSRIEEVQIQEAALSPFQREQRLFDEAVRQAETNYVEINHSPDDFLSYCKSNLGGITLLTGVSGSGKSMLLRHCYYLAHGIFVLSCADILPSCSRVSHALWFCLKQLEAKGILGALDVEPDAEHCAAWFEKQLEGLRSDTQVTILLDSIDQIWDWNQIGGSLLECKIPPNVTLVICCISEDSLNERDRGRIVSCYRLQPLEEHDSIYLLKRMLHKRGRLLGEDDEQIIRKGLPEEPTPLYMQLLCRQLQSRRSFDSRPLILPVGTRESIFMQLKEPSQNYRKLYNHAIGYLALAADGLSEQELLTLLEKDDPVLQEIKQYTHWEIKQARFTISVFWARIYYDLKDYLSEVDSNGILLLRFHHDLVRQVVKDMVGKDTLLQLSYVMGSYFLEEPVYLNRTKDNKLVNIRKLRELMPALRFQDDWTAAARVLADPEYVDGYLRCGWYRDLMQQLTDLGQHRSLNEIHRKILALLQDKAMQFQLWGDSFLPAAMESGIYPQKNMDNTGWKYILRNRKQPVLRENIWKDKILLPNAANVKLAVKENGALAILEGKVLKRYDLNLRSEIYPRCYVDVVNAFLYWKGDSLFVRDNSCRISFLDTGSELVQVQKESCRPLVDLYSDDINKIISAGGFVERDHADYFKDTVFEYYSHGMLKSTELFYPDVEDIKCFCHGVLCAVLLNQCRLDIVDLEQRLLLASYAVPNACLAYWSPQGKEVLVVFERDKVQMFSYSYNHSMPLAAPCMSMKKHEKAYRTRVGRREILKIFQMSCPMNGKDTPAYFGSVLGSRRPIYAAFSIAGNRLACYYYYLNQGVVRLFRLNDRKLLAESTVDPIFWNDSVGRPIYFDENGCVLVLISRGKKHFWKMDSLKWEHNVKMASDSQTGFSQELQEKYFRCVKPWLPVRNRGISPHRKGILDVIRQIIMFVLLPIICSQQLDRDSDGLLCQSMQQIPVVESGSFWWILDCYHGMIHVCDQNGYWVCHEQLQEEIFDFNVIGSKVYVLPTDLSDPVELDLVSV